MLSILDIILNVMSVSVGVCFLIGLMYVVNKVSNVEVGTINNTKYVNIVEKMPIGRDTYVMLLKLGEDGVVILNNAGNSEVLKTLSSDEINTIISKKKANTEDKGVLLGEVLKKVKNRKKV